MKTAQRWMVLMALVLIAHRAQAGFAWSGPSASTVAGGGPAFTLSVEFRDVAGGREVRATIVSHGPALNSWAIYGGVADSPYSQAFLYNDYGSGDTLGQWYPCFRGPNETPLITIEVNGDWEAETFWADVSDGYKFLLWTVNNTTEYWRTAGIFVLEYPGVMFAAKRIAPRASGDLLIVVRGDDPSHYYPAFVDAAASNAAGSRLITVPGDNGRDVSHYEDVVADSGTVGEMKTAAVGEATDIVLDYPEETVIDPRSQVGPGTGGAVTTGLTGTFDAAAASEVGNAIAQTLDRMGSAVVSAVLSTSASEASILRSMDERLLVLRDTTNHHTWHFWELQKRLNTANERLTSVDSRLASANTSLTSIAGKLDQLKTAGDTTNTKLTGIATKVDRLTENSDKWRSILTKAEEFKNGDALSAAQAAAGAVGPYTGKRPGSGAPNVTVSLGNTSAIWRTVTIAGRTLNIGLTGGLEGTHALMLLMRPVLLAAMCIGFLRGISGHITTYTAALPQVTAQDSTVGPENIVPGVAQSKTWGTAAAAVSVVFGGAAALVALADTMVTYFGGGLGSIFSALSVPGSGGLWVIDQYVPLAPALSLSLLGAAAPYLLAPVYLAAAAVLRFLKT